DGDRGVAAAAQGGDPGEGDGGGAPVVVGAAHADDAVDVRSPAVDALVERDPFDPEALDCAPVVDGVAGAELGDRPAGRGHGDGGLEAGDGRLVVVERRAIHRGAAPDEAEGVAAGHQGGGGGADGGEGGGGREAQGPAVGARRRGGRGPVHAARRAPDEDQGR